MTDTCGVCNRPLLDPSSRAAGIGPKCAEKFHGSRAAAGSHQLTFEEHDMTDPTPNGRCGNDPRTVLSPGDQAAVAQFTEYLLRKRRAFSAAVEEPETEEQRADREETERAHEAGDHEHCGPTCEVEFPSDMLRNTILYAALPGSARMLDELLRRAAAEAGQDAERYKADHLGACTTIAEMHEAATGRTGMGPIRGVVEDVADVRTRADQAEAAIKRTVDQMRAYVVASGQAGVNPNQVIGLLSLTWPDGNHEAPAPGVGERS